MPSLRQILRSLFPFFFPKQQQQPVVEPEPEPEVRRYLAEWTSEAVRARNLMNFNKIMALPDAVSFLKPFARGAGLTVLLTAWTDMQTYRLTLTADWRVARAKADRILSTYLEGRPAVITISNVRMLQENVMKGFLSADIFEDAETFVKETLFSKVYPKFVSTPEYRHALAMLEDVDKEMAKRSRATPSATEQLVNPHGNNNEQILSASMLLARVLHSPEDSDFD